MITSGFGTDSPDAPAALQVSATGAIFRDLGPPLDTTGDIGNVYMDVSLNPPQLYLKRAATGTFAPWGPYIFTLPSETGPPVNLWSQLKWFGSSPPYPTSRPYNAPTVGETGDYFIMWQGPQTPSVYPRLFGPKGYAGAPGWPEQGDGPTDIQAPVLFYTAIGVAPTGSPTAPPNNEDGSTPTDPLYSGPGCLTLEGVAFYGNTPDVQSIDPVDTTTIPAIGLETLGITFPGMLNPNWDTFSSVTVDETTIGGAGTPASPLHVIPAGLADQVAVAVDGSTITGNGTSASPLTAHATVSVSSPITGTGASSSPLGINVGALITQLIANMGLNDNIAVAVDGTTVAGAGITGSPLHVVSGSSAVSVSSPLTGTGASGNPLGVAIASLITALIANTGLNDHVQVAVDGTTIAGNGTSTPLHVVAGSSAVVTALPITGNGTSGSPLNWDPNTGASVLVANGGLNDRVQVAVSSPITGNGLTATPLGLNIAALYGAVEVAVDGTSMTGNGLTGNPLISHFLGASVDGTSVTGNGLSGTPLVSHFLGASVTSPITGNGTSGSPLGLNIAATTTAIISGAGLNDNVQVAVDGTTITGNGTSGSPLVAHSSGFTGLTGVTAPLQGVGTAGSPLNINLATLATDLADTVPVATDGSTITGNGTTASPLTIPPITPFGLQAVFDANAGIMRGFTVVSSGPGSFVFTTPQPDTNYYVMIQTINTTGSATMDASAKTTIGFTTTATGGGGSPSTVILAVFR